MPDAHNQLAFLAHAVDEFHWVLAGVVSLAELAGRRVQRTTETVALHTQGIGLQLHKKAIDIMRYKLTMVKSPDTREETRSLPALAQTIVL